MQVKPCAVRKVRLIWWPSLWFKWKKTCSYIQMELISSQTSWPCCDRTFFMCGRLPFCAAFLGEPPYTQVKWARSGWHSDSFLCDSAQQYLFDLDWEKTSNMHMKSITKRQCNLFLSHYKDFYRKWSLFLSHYKGFLKGMRSFLKQQSFLCATFPQI